MRLHELRGAGAGRRRGRCTRHCRRGDDEVIVEGQARSAGSGIRAAHARVDPGFADVYGLRLREGRFIDQRDRADSLPVAVIDARLARELWPDRSPLDLRLRLDPDDTQAASLTVVGVIEELRRHDAAARRAGAA